MRTQILTLVVLAFTWFATSPAYAAKKSHGGENKHNSTGAASNEAIKTAEDYIKNWPVSLRDAHIAFSYELYFVEDGSSPFQEGGRETYYVQNGIKMPKTIRAETKFIATDGKEYGLNSAIWNTLKSSTTPEYKEWSFILATEQKYSVDTVLSSYSKEVKIMRQYFAQRNMSSNGTQGEDNMQKDDPQEDVQEEDDQEEEVQEERSQKEQARDFKNVTKKIQQEIAGEARTALVACLLEDVPVQKALKHSYANSKGEQCFVYEQLLHEGCLEAVLEVLDKTRKSPSIKQKVLAKFEKKRKSLEKGEKLRALHMQALQKQYEAYEAEVKSQITGDSDESDVKSTFNDAVGIIEQAKEPLCRAALLQIAAKGLNIKQLFSETVLDSQQASHSCYDVLNNAGMLEQAFKMMMNVAESRILADKLAARYPDEHEAQKEGREKRDKSIRLALKQYEAKALQNDIRELEKE